MLPLPADPRLRTLCHAQQANPDSRTSLQQWADRLDVSERTLSRLFVLQTGLTFRLWRQRLRLLTALPMLERGERVTDAALACGYESLSAFIAAFREQFGATPGEFFPARHPM
jgi:AraC-like DNA-binding protein